MKNRKLEILNKILPEQEEAIEAAMLTWWHNLRDHGGLRLTLRGYDALVNQLKLQCWTIDIKDFRSVFSKRVYLDLDRKLSWPYYIDRKNHCLVLFGSRDAVLARLYGDVIKWLAAVPNR